eukprot:scaffold2663_cov256-Pinguiococcus_pyrenoidosus.AAC.8
MGGEGPRFLEHRGAEVLEASVQLRVQDEPHQFLLAHVEHMAEDPVVQICLLPRRPARVGHIHAGEAEVPKGIVLRPRHKHGDGIGLFALLAREFAGSVQLALYEAEERVEAPVTVANELLHFLGLRQRGILEQSLGFHVQLAATGRVFAL